MLLILQRGEMVTGFVRRAAAGIIAVSARMNRQQLEAAKRPARGGVVERTAPRPESGMQN